MDKLFHRPSNEHAGMKTGNRVRLLKDLSDIGGSIAAGSECIIESIIHFPTRYRVEDENGQIWTVPIHSVELLTDETENEEETEAVAEGEADQGGE